ncbi:MAG: nucleotide pyrophosphohydrolase [Thermoproteota archaeon]|nr:MAG: nucleotide pyrophosphohydrolase [Candidatus Korarchaeota archaeon]
MKLSEMQQMITEIYGERDKRRGVNRTFIHLVEEVGELARALRGGDSSEMSRELADTLAWLLSVSSLLGIDLETAFMSRYSNTCPKCKSSPCICPPV